MRVALTQLALRTTCGVGLLLVAAVQQKVCTLPAPEAPSAAQPADQAAEHHPSKKTPHLELVSLVPDVAPPRWPGHLRLAAALSRTPLPAATWRSDGDHGPRLVLGQAVANWPDRGWLVPLWQWSHSPGADAAQAWREAGVFRTCLLRTGPPLI